MKTNVKIQYTTLVLRNRWGNIRNKPKKCKICRKPTSVLLKSYNIDFDQNWCRKTLSTSVLAKIDVVMQKITSVFSKTDVECSLTLVLDQLMLFFAKILNILFAFTMNQLKLIYKKYINFKLKYYFHYNITLVTKSFGIINKENIAE